MSPDASTHSPPWCGPRGPALFLLRVKRFCGLNPIQLLLLLVFGVRLRGVWGFRWEQVGMLFHADFFPSTKAARAKM